MPPASRPEKPFSLLSCGVAASRGFTLVECLMVLTIIVVLAAVVLGAGRQVGESGRVARTKAELATLAGALEAYKRQYGDYPRTERADEMLQSLLGRRGPTGAATEGGVLLELARFRTAGGLDPFTNSGAELVDAWEQPYRYVYRPSTSWVPFRYVLGSAGPDGGPPVLRQDGTLDRNAPGGADNLFADR